MERERKKNQGRCTLPTNLESICHMVTCQTSLCRGCGMLLQSRVHCDRTTTPCGWIYHSLEVTMAYQPGRPCPLGTGWQCMTAMQERHRQCIRLLEQPTLHVHVNKSMGSGSSQLVGGVPQFQRPRREQGNRRHPESMRLGHIDDRPKPDLLQEEEEEVDHHLPLQNAWEEQIQMIIWWPVSQVKVAGIGDAGRQREDWLRQDWTYPYFVLQMRMLMWPMKYGASMYKAGWISMMKQVCTPTSSVAYKVILENGSLLTRRYEHLLEWPTEAHGPYFWKCAWLWQHDSIVVWDLSERKWNCQGVHA